MSNEIDIEKLALANGLIPRSADDCECYADADTLKQFAEAYHKAKCEQSEAVGYCDQQSITNFRTKSSNKEWMWATNDNGLLPIYTTPPDQSAEIERLKALIGGDMTEWIKDGETIIQRLERERKDLSSTLGLLAKDKAQIERLKAREARLLEVMDRVVHCCETGRYMVARELIKEIEAENDKATN